ncbi:glycosyltransferase [Marinimicrobium locisalis]|uniref:glycosyltransferase n=1 Tax=Marinimicrobium locisalis TaxID=546022 RepID=UPI003221407C
MSQPKEVHGSSRGNGDFLFFVCSFGNDEPVEEIVKSYGNLPTEVKLIISGNWKRRFTTADMKSMPTNVEFTGFISDAEFTSLMAESSGVVVLTKNEFTLNCGAYEALSLNKPLLLSNTLALRGYFKNVANFVDLRSQESISSGLRKFQNGIAEDDLGSRWSSIRDMKKAWSLKADELDYELDK